MCAEKRVQYLTYDAVGDHGVSNAHTRKESDVLKENASQTHELSAATSLVESLRHALLASGGLIGLAFVISFAQTSAVTGLFG